MTLGQIYLKQNTKTTDRKKNILIKQTFSRLKKKVLEIKEIKRKTTNWENFFPKHIQPSIVLSIHKDSMQHNN